MISTKRLTPTKRAELYEAAKAYEADYVLLNGTVVPTKAKRSQ